MQNQAQLLRTQINEAIKSNNVQFFQQTECPNGTWGFYNYSNIPRSCLSLAIEHGSKDVIQYFLDNLGEYDLELLNGDQYLGQAVRYLQYAYYANDVEKQTNQKLIIEALINKGANPNYKPEKDPSIAFVVAAIQLADDQLMKMACESKYPLNLEFIVSLFRESFISSDNRRFILPALKNNFGSLNVVDFDTTLFLAALDQNLPLAQELLEEPDFDPNLCGFGAESPLKILERKVANTKRRITEHEQSQTETVERAASIINAEKTKFGNKNHQYENDKKVLTVFTNMQDALLNKGARSFDNRFPRIPTALKPYAEPAKFSDPNYSFDNFCMDIYQKAATTEQDQKFVAAMQSNSESNEQFEISEQLQDAIDAVNWYWEEVFSKLTSKTAVTAAVSTQNNNNDNVEEKEIKETKVSVETDSFVSAKVEQKQSAPKGWLSLFCCFKNSYQQVDEDDKQLTSDSIPTMEQ